jgi:CheY-like chemotaxis protein
MKPKVLIVDDDPLMLVLYKRHLEAAGYELLTAKEGAEGVSIALRDSPQLILMDLLMPGMDGLSALRELKTAETTKGIPVVIITANVSSYTTKHESEMAGAAGFLPKPFSPAQLLAEVQRHAPVS